MRSLLSHNLIKNITKSVKSNPNCHFDGYDECSTDTIDKLRETQCINLDDSDAFIFNPPVSVKDLNGATTEEVYVISEIYQINKSNLYYNQDVQLHVSYY